MPATTPILVTVERAAEMLAIGRTRMFALLRDGDIPSVLIGRSRRVPVAALEQYVAGLTVVGSADDDRAA